MANPEIKIEKNVPLPDPGVGTSGAGKYPWAKMEVGDSFLFSTDNDLKAIKSASNQAWGAGRRLGRKFANRKTEQGIRVWRTA